MVYPLMGYTTIPLMGIPLMMGIVCKWYIPFFNQPLLGMVDHPSPKKNGLNGAVRHLPGCE
jgi:hypothetical protein